MFNRILILSMVLLFIATGVFAQVGGIVQLTDPKGKPVEYSQTRALTTDSADFYSSFIFHIPPGVRADSVQLLIAGYSVGRDDTIDVDITSMWGFKKAGARGRDVSDYFWYTDSTAVATYGGNTGNVAEAYAIVHATNDTLPNGAGSAIMPYAPAIRINVKGGGATNSADVDFWLTMFGILDTDK